MGLGARSWYGARRPAQLLQSTTSRRTGPLTARACSSRAWGKKHRVGSPGTTVAGGEKAQKLIHTPSNDAQGQFSPDGRWVAYASDESGRLEVYVQPFPLTGARWPVSTAGGSGREPGVATARSCFFWSPSRVGMHMAVDVVTDTEKLPVEQAASAVSTARHRGHSWAGTRLALRCHARRTTIPVQTAR